jgi:hypothetical protein
MGIEAEKLDSRGTYGGNYAQSDYDGRSFRGGESSNNEEWAEPPIEGMLKTCMMGGTFEGRNNRITNCGRNFRWEIGSKKENGDLYQREIGSKKENNNYYQGDFCSKKKKEDNYQREFCSKRNYGQKYQGGNCSKKEIKHCYQGELCSKRKYGQNLQWEIGSKKGNGDYYQGKFMKKGARKESDTPKRY